MDCIIEVVAVDGRLVSTLHTDMNAEALIMAKALSAGLPEHLVKVYMRGKLRRIYQSTHFKEV